MTLHCVVGHDFPDKDLGRACRIGTGPIFYACEKHKDCLNEKYAIGGSSER